MKQILFINLHGKLGMFHYSYHFANAVAKMDCQQKMQVAVLLPSYSETSVFEPNIHLVQVRASHSAASFLWETFYIPNWVRIVRAFSKADTIHFLDNHPWMFILLPLTRLFGKECVVTVHDPAPHSGESNSFFRWLQKGVIDLSLKTASRIVIHSESYRELLPQSVQSKLVIVPHGIYNQLPQPQNSVIRDRNSILFFGRIRDYKGLDILVKAWQGVNFSDKKLVIAGEGEIEKDILQTIQADSHIELVNRHIDDQEIAAFFLHSSLLVLPYRNATQSGPLLLAYNYRMPVIATEVGSLPEYIQENTTGWVVPPEDSSALQKQIENFYAVPQEKVTEMGESAFTLAQEKYSWNAIAKRIYCEEYEKISLKL